MVRLLLAFALAFSSVQCVASCAADDCGSPKTPPCHQGAPAMKACPHELVLDRSQSVVTSAIEPPLYQLASLPVRPVATEIVPAISGPSPDPPLSLRI
jgi:hypothetical protein